MFSNKSIAMTITCAVALLLTVKGAVAYAEAGDPLMVAIPDKDYEIGKFEVTQGEWRRIMGSGPIAFSSCGDNCPVEGVSWNDAQDFINKLNARTGLKYRLPTEAEWEYACYAGSKTRYCGGDDPDAVAWYDNDSNDQTHPVGQKQKNGYGLYDMSGNVGEWVQDRYDKDPDLRILRGGSWVNSKTYLVASYRFTFAPGLRLITGSGFRLARTLR